MTGEIERFIGTIEDERLRAMVDGLLREPCILLDSARLSLDETPAGAYVHHPHRGGLVQHTAAVARLVLALCDIVEGVYGSEVDRDVVLAGALLHDVMKCHVYAPDKRGGFSSSPLGERIDHLTLLVAEMYRRGFPLDVIHVAASHHGDISPIKPRTVEALIVSIADYADSEFNQKVLRAAEYLLRQAGQERRPASTQEALEIVAAKAKRGLEGVHGLVRRED